MESGNGENRANLVNGFLRSFCCILCLSLVVVLIYIRQRWELVVNRALASFSAACCSLASLACHWNYLGADRKIIMGQKKKKKNERERRHTVFNRHIPHNIFHFLLLKGFSLPLGKFVLMGQCDKRKSAKIKFRKNRIPRERKIPREWKNSTRMKKFRANGIQKNLSSKNRNIKYKSYQCRFAAMIKVNPCTVL